MAIAEPSLITNVIQEAAQPLEGTPPDYDQLNKLIGKARFCLLGDARATYMADYGELNVGQLARERYGPDAVLIRFTTYTGTVTAASNWDGPADRKCVRPALGNSYEATFHDVDARNFLLPLRDTGPASIAVRDPRLERAIGVI